MCSVLYKGNPPLFKLFVTSGMEFMETYNALAQLFLGNTLLLIIMYSFLWYVVTSNLYCGQQKLFKLIFFKGFSVKRITIISS